MEDQNRTVGKTSKTAVLIEAIITTFMAPFMISAVNIARPAIQYEFADIFYYQRSLKIWCLNILIGFFVIQKCFI